MGNCDMSSHDGDGDDDNYDEAVAVSTETFCNIISSKLKLNAVRIAGSSLKKIFGSINFASYVAGVMDVERYFQFGGHGYNPPIYGDVVGWNQHQIDWDAYRHLYTGDGLPTRNENGDGGADVIYQAFGADVMKHGIGAKGLKNTCAIQRIGSS